MEKHEIVVCPNCNGSKKGVVSPFGKTNPCSLCRGKGTVAKFDLKAKQ